MCTICGKTTIYDNEYCEKCYSIKDTLRYLSDDLREEVINARKKDKFVIVSEFLKIVMIEDNIIPIFWKDNKYHKKIRLTE